MTLRAPRSSTACARSTVLMPPPTRQGSRAQIDDHERAVVPGVLRRVQIDQLHFREPGEPRDPAVEVVGGHREMFALHELDDTAALEIDGGNQHQSLTGHAARRAGSP